MAAGNAKIPGQIARILRDNGTPAIEAGWTVTRIEPESGNAIVEKDSVRASVARADFDLYNFAGSDELWEIVTAPEPDEAQKKALAAWTAKDIVKVRLALLEHARGLGRALIGVQTASDLETAAAAKSEEIPGQIRILEMDLARAQKEYDRYTPRTAFENDKKDSLLTRLENIKNELDARMHERDVILPVWTKLLAALRGVDAALAERR